MKTAESEADARNVAYYMGAILAGLPGDAALSHVPIDLVGLPENFRRMEEFNITTWRYAAALPDSSIRCSSRRSMRRMLDW